MIPYLILMKKNKIKRGGSFDEPGQTLVEYALILALVTIAIISTLALLGVNLGETYETIAQLVPNISLSAKPFTINYSKDVQGYIQWFLVDN